MVRSIWRGALVVSLAWVGLAWSQPAGSPSATETRTMTVRENGKDLPCRVVISWQQANGAKAFQLQVIATGEMLTLVEDGPSTTYQGKSGKMRALSMRIFHWGNRRTSPPGVPVPPERIHAEPEPVKPIILSESNVKLITLTPEPVLGPGCKMWYPPTPIGCGNQACNPAPSGACPCGQPSAGPARIPGTGTYLYAQMPTGSKQVPDQAPLPKPETSTMAQGTQPAMSSGSPVRKTGSNSSMQTQVMTGPANPNQAQQPGSLAGQAGALGQNQNSCDPQKSSAGSTGVAQKTTSSGCAVTPAETGTGKTSAPLATTMAGTPTTLPKVVPDCQPNSPPPAVMAAKTPQAATECKAQEKKTTWQKMWGKSWFAKTKQPGQTTVEPTPTGKGPTVPGPKAPASISVAAASGMPAQGTTSPATPSNLVPGGPGTLPQAVAQGKVAMPPASFTERQMQTDPLLNPGQIRSPRLESKVGPIPATPLTNGLANTVPGQPTGGMLDQMPSLPMGSGSVVAAQNGLPIPYRYMPVPLVTVPNPLRTPGPPPPNVPEPPAPNAYVNAFTPAKAKAAPKPGEGQQNPMPPNVAMGPYGPLPDPRLMGYPPALVPPGMVPYPGMNPYLMPQVANGAGMMPQAPMITPLGMQRPVAQVNYPSNYQGPMPPNPMIGSNMPAMPYQQPMPPAMAMPHVGNPAMDRPGLAPGGSRDGGIIQMLGLLRDSISPAEREMAALNLTNQDWRGHPEIVQGLVTSARQDPAATVRAGCVHSLAQQNINTEPVLSTLNALKSDPDPRVRKEVDQALDRLTGAQAPANNQALQPIGCRP